MIPLSIVIVNYKNPAMLRMCLKSLERAEISIPHEVVIIDVASEKETQDVVLEEFPKSKIIPFDKNIGHVKGMNEAIKNTEGKYIFQINADVVVLKGSVEALYNYMEKHNQTAVIGPQLLGFDGKPQDSCFRFATPFSVAYRRIGLPLPFYKKVINRYLMRDIDLTQITPADWIQGSAFMIRRETIDRVGLMDERLFLYFGEVDWQRRFWDNGYQVIYYPEAKVYHYHRRESKSGLGFFDVFTNRLTRIHIWDGMKYFWKYKFFNNPTRVALKN